LTYLEDFKKSIDFSTLLLKHPNEFNSVKSVNSTFKMIDTIYFMIDAVIYAYTLFDHME